MTGRRQRERSRARAREPCPARDESCDRLRAASYELPILSLSRAMRRGREGRGRDGKGGAGVVQAGSPPPPPLLCAATAAAIIYVSRLWTIGLRVTNLFLSLSFLFPHCCIHMRAYVHVKIDYSLFGLLLRRSIIIDSFNALSRARAGV